jgi:hypothetical protein
MKQVKIFGYVFSFGFTKIVKPSYMVDIRSDEGLLMSGWLENLEDAETYARVKLQWLDAKNVVAQAAIFSSEDNCSLPFDIYFQDHEKVCLIRSVGEVRK